MSESARELDEELEIGEPLDEPAPAKKKIRARVVPFDGRAPQPREPERTERSEPANSGGGHMVLTTAKYLPPQPVEPEPRPGQKRRPGQPAQEAGDSEGGAFGGGMWGGLLAMVVAVVWFMVGLMNDFIYFYPPILFVIGLTTFMKGTLKGK